MSKDLVLTDANPNVVPNKVKIISIMCNHCSALLEQTTEAGLLLRTGAHYHNCIMEGKV